MTDLKAIEKEGLQKINGVSTLSELEQVEKDVFGRKRGVLTAAMNDLKSLSPEEKKEQGKALNVLKKKLEAALEKKRLSFEKEQLGSLAKDDSLDMTMDLPEKERGHLHLVPEFMRQLEEVFGRMGFDVAYGPEIEDEENNFDLLNIPEDHPARDTQDTFWMHPQKSKKVLRTHTSPVQIRYMKERKPPFRMICPGKVFRKDADATHSPMFHQVEGLMIGKDVSLRHLKGVIVAAFRELISPDIEFRFRTGYFPFTEPSMEMDMKWQGEKEAKEGKWLEMGGCGMVHPNVLRNVGIDPEEWQGFAFGFGIERPLMIKYQIPNIKHFYQGDLRFLRQF